MCGCSKQNVYEKAIADFVQADKKGTWTDMQLKVIEMDTPAQITSIIPHQSPCLMNRYSMFSIPKKNGQWKSGFSSPMGFQDRKCGFCSPSPHL